jgi:superfamily II DNA or RNA helicase
MKTLRPYQDKIITDLRDSIARGNRSVVVQVGTGAGKSLIAAEVISRATQRRSKCLFLAPRRELIHQAHDTLAKHGVQSGIIMAGVKPFRLMDVQVASVDTLLARAVRAKRMELPEAKLVVVDEFHLWAAESRAKLLGLYPDAKIVGLTATPARGDGRGLCEIADDMVHGPSIRELCDAGYLLPMRYFAPSEPDLKGLRLNKDGDYQETGLARRMNQPKLIGDIVSNWQRIAPERATVVFCCSIQHSIAVCEAFVRAGVKAEHVDAETAPKDRAAIFGRVMSGETQVLTNVFIASYGLDIPHLSCVVLARPTKNITLYLQSIGRVMRPYPGQDDCILIDHAGAVKENGFADDDIPWSLDGKDKVKERKDKLAKEKKEPAQINCPQCHTVFTGRHICPSCGWACVRAGKPLPVQQADLGEIVRGKATASEKRNAVHNWQMKTAFMGELRRYAAAHGKADGWVAHKYRDRYSVWPNDPRLLAAQPREPSVETLSWIKAGQIRFAKSRAVA